MIRLFIALKIPLHIREEIVKLSKGFLPGTVNYKWEPIEKIHLTLKFVGDVKEESVDDIINKISFVENYHKFECGLDNFGFFYRSGKPSIFFIRLQMDNIINEVVKKLNTELEELNIQAEKKDFKSHLTLLRFRGYEDLEFLKELSKTVLTGKFTADEIVLYKSKLLQHGSEYTELKNYKLR
jgi:2'-5' RNA ligase